MTFERYTERARKVVLLAEECARSLGWREIGSEHLLFGIVEESEGVGARALMSLELNVQRVGDAVERIGGRGDQSPTGRLLWSPEGDRICGLALREALSLGHNYIGTEHILLAIVRDSESVGLRVLLDCGVDSELVRCTVIGLLSGPRSPTSRRERASAAECWAEYEICRRRGHQGDSATGSKKRCRWCGTIFWTEPVLRERNAPANPESAA